MVRNRNKSDILYKKSDKTNVTIICSDNNEHIPI